MRATGFGDSMETAIRTEGPEAVRERSCEALLGLRRFVPGIAFDGRQDRDIAEVCRTLSAVEIPIGAPEDP